METLDQTIGQIGSRAGAQTGNSSGEMGAGESGGRAPQDFISAQLLPEQLLASLWQRRAARQQRFKTNGGRQVRVLYPGRPSSSAGPDFTIVQKQI